MEDKQERIIAEILRIAKEDVPYGEFKVTIKTHQGRIASMREEHKERTTTIV